LPRSKGAGCSGTDPVSLLPVRPRERGGEHEGREREIKGRGRREVGGEGRDVKGGKGSSKGLGRGGKGQTGELKRERAKRARWSKHVITMCHNCLCPRFVTASPFVALEEHGRTWPTTVATLFWEIAQRPPCMACTRSHLQGWRSCQPQPPAPAAAATGPPRQRPPQQRPAATPWSLPCCWPRLGLPGRAQQARGHAQSVTGGRGVQFGRIRGA
jgi:hypothetical protein